MQPLFCRCCNIGSTDIRLLSITPNSAAVSIRGRRKEMALGKDIAFQMGGKEQMGSLSLLEIKDNAVKFKIRFGSGPPAPEIPEDMSRDIIYLE